MGQQTTHKWVCDGCDEVSPHTDSRKPSDWVIFQLRVVNGLTCDKDFTVCSTCFSVLFQNRRKGPTWFNRLKKVIGLAAHGEEESHG